MHHRVEQSDLEELCERPGSGPGDGKMRHRWISGVKLLKKS
jgi:hypothetical protein